MKILSFKRSDASRIDAFDSTGAWAQSLGSGAGTSHFYSIYIDAASSIGPHPTGFCQLFLVVSGSGWVATEDNVRVEIQAGEGAYFKKGEVHSKGSELGMHAILIQVDEMVGE